MNKIILRTFLLLLFSFTSISRIFSENPASDFLYDLTSNGKGVVILEYCGKSRIIEFPSIIEGFPVLEIGRPFGDNTIFEDGTKLFGGNKYKGIIFEKVCVPDSVVSIHSRAFWNAHIKKLEIADSVKSLDISNIHELEYLKLPNQIDQHTFSIQLADDCKLKELTVPKSSSTYYNIYIELYDKDKANPYLKKINLSEGTKKLYITGDLSNIEEVILPSSIEYFCGRILISEKTKFEFHSKPKFVSYSGWGDWSSSERLMLFIKSGTPLLAKKEIIDFWSSLGFTDTQDDRLY